MRLPDLTTSIRTTITIALGGIGASAGFTHTHDWASAHGQHGWLAWADAVVIEGMAVVAGFEVHRDHQAGRKGLTVPQVVLLVAFLVQMTAQVAQAEKSPEGWLLAAMPALGFLTVVKLAMRRIPTPVSDRPPATTPPTTPPQTTPQLAAVQSSPAEQPATAVVNRLPAAIRRTVITTAEQAHRDGRPITAEDIRATLSLPAPMLTDLIAELNATVNHHPISHTAPSGKD